jgi:hypothetical protein
MFNINDKIKLSSARAIRGYGRKHGVIKAFIETGYYAGMYQVTLTNCSPDVYFHADDMKLKK